MTRNKANLFFGEHFISIDASSRSKSFTFLIRTCYQASNKSAMSKAYKINLSFSCFLFQNEMSNESSKILVYAKYDGF